MPGWGTSFWHYFWAYMVPFPLWQPHVSAGHWFFWIRKMHQYVTQIVNGKLIHLPFQIHHQLLCFSITLTHFTIFLGLISRLATNFRVWLSKNAWRHLQLRMQNNKVALTNDIWNKSILINDTKPFQKLSFLYLQISYAESPWPQ